MIYPGPYDTIHKFKTPQEITKTFTIDSYAYNINNVILNRSANISVIFFDICGTVFKQINLTISGEIYNNWGNDDNYLLDFIDNNVDFIISGNNMVITEEPRASSE